MTGRLVIAGLGPGSPHLVTPEVSEALADATDIVGSTDDVARVSTRPGQVRYATENCSENERARQALALAAAGQRVAIVSSGDPGVFAAATAVFEAIEQGEPVWRELEVQVLPGITAMLAAAARIGAPLGHDFCAINLSDDLKPWELIERRLLLAARGDFALALYNPVSQARPYQLARAFDLLRTVCAAETPVIFAKRVSDQDENIVTVPLGGAIADRADARTVVLIGSSQTRVVARRGRPPFGYTPRSAQT